VLAGDRADEKEADAGAFDAHGDASGNAVEALEDALELVGLEADAGIGDGERNVGVADDADGALDVNAVGGVFDGVVEDVEDGGAEVFCNDADVEADCAGYGSELDCLGGQVVALEGDGDTVGDEGGEFEEGAVLVAAAGAKFAGFENLLDGRVEAVGIGEHDFVELLALRFRDFAALEGFEVEADGGDGGFKLVGDGVEEGILALVAADFADQEDGVEDDSGDQQSEEDDAEDDKQEAALVDDDPGDVEGDKATDDEDSEGY